MKVAKCMSGHYFDADARMLCPHCGAPQFVPENTDEIKMEMPKDEEASALLQRDVAIVYGPPPSFDDENSLPPSDIII